MHNLHYVVIEAENGAEACSNVESELESWGNENNWRVMCGAVRSDGKVYNSGEGRWADEESLSLSDIENNLKEALFGEDEQNLDKLVSAVKNNDPFAWYSLKKYASKMSDRYWAIGSDAKNKLTPDNLDVFNCDYRDWKFDEFGITNLANSDSKKENLWIVLVDMHS